MEEGKAMKALEGTQHKKSLLTVVEPNNEEKRTIVVLGVERGGTSMVAGMIRALGVDLGERAGRNHEDPKFLTDDEAKLLQQIKINNEAKSVWGFKIPKASMMLDFYDKHLRNPHYVLVFRNIEATVDSWCSRGSNDPMDSALHAMKYYDAALNYFKGKKRPLAFASYERACDDPEGFAASLAEFVGASQGDDAVKKAASIVTGEGGGYVDLPEYYFHMDALECDHWPEQVMGSDIAEGSERHLNVANKKVGDRVILHPQEEFFPKDFYLGFHLESQSSALLEEQGLRIYMDFTGEFFPGHAFRPPLRQGKNLMKISTHGNVRRLALGALKPEYVFGFKDVLLFEGVQNSVEATSFQVMSMPAPLPLPFFSRVKRKIKLILKTNGK